MSRADIARLMTRDRKRVCAFPINGTRRWYLIEQLQRGTLPATEADYLRDYITRSAENHRHLYRLLFEHGIHTILTSLFGLSLLERGHFYAQVGLNQGLAQLATPEFRAFYRELGIRVRFYGDYRRVLPQIGYGHLTDLLEGVMADTAHHDQRVLFYGVCADDPVDTVAQLAVQHYQEHGVVPTRAQLIELYYGEPVAPLDLFIGFDEPHVFDVPLLATGNEDIYFTVNPSPYLDETELRLILYDHLYARPVPETDYTDLTPEAWRALQAFYEANRHTVLGVGRKHVLSGVWYPTTQIKLTDSFGE